MGKIKFKDRHNWLLKDHSLLNHKVLGGVAKEIVSTDGLFSTFAVVGKHFVPKPLGIFHLFLHCLPS